MALAYSSTLQDAIAQRLSAIAYASLNANDKQLIDGTSSASPPTAGAAFDAWQILDSASRCLNMTASGTIPDEWRPWFIATAVKIAAQSMRPDRLAYYKELEEEAFGMAIDFFQRKAATYDPAADTEAYTATTQTFRYYIQNCCAHRKPRLIVPWETVDAHVWSAIRNVWNRQQWNFRRVPVTISVATNEAVTITGTSAFDSTATRMFYYTDVGGAGQPIKFVNADDMSRLKSLGSAAARPRYFRITEVAGTKAWAFWPTPDQTYELRGEVFTRSPVAPTSASDATPFNAFPADFMTMIRDYSLALTLRGCGVETDLFMLVEREIDRLAMIYSSQGRLESDQSIRDVIGDTGVLAAGRPVWYGGYQMGGGM